MKGSAQQVEAAIQEVAAAISEIVKTHGEVMGSRLSSELKSRFPSWTPAEFGVRNLREFIAKHVLKVCVAGRAGMDVLYATTGTIPVASTVTTLDADSDYWRVWISPNSPHALAIEPTGKEIRTIHRGSEAPTGYTILQPPGPDAHREVAKTFLGNLPPTLQTRLQISVESSNEKWWQKWSQDLRDANQLYPWKTFRREQFERLLENRLRENGLTQTAICNVLKLVRDRHVDSLRRLPMTNVPRKHESEDDVRRIVLGAIALMSASELRELRLPVGLILDVLAASKPR